MATTESRGDMAWLEGGSPLGTPNCCLRYRPPARQGEAVDTSSSHIGFRCLVRAGDRGGP